MNSLHCCQQKSRPGDAVSRPTTWLGLVRGVAGLILPGALLALMPKCPLCLAVYVALGTGVTMSYSSAHLLMRTLVALCLGMLGLCVVRRVVSCCRNKPTLNLQPTQTPR